MDTASLIRNESIVSDAGGAAPPQRQSTSEPPPMFTQDGSFSGEGCASDASAVAAVTRLSTLDLPSDGVLRGVEEFDDVRPPSSAAPSSSPLPMTTSTTHSDAAQVPLVPAQVLDEAKATITLLMEEIELLREELDEATRRHHRDSTAAADATTRIEAMSDALGSPIRQAPTAILDSSATPGMPLSFQSTHPSKELLEAAKRTVQQRNRVIQQLQKQLSSSKAVEAALTSELAAATADIEKHKKREQTLVHQLEHLRRDVAARDAQLDATRQSSAEMLLGLEARLMAWRAHEQTSLPAAAGAAIQQVGVL